MAIDTEIISGWITYESGGTAIDAYECRPVEGQGRLPAVIVLHEIWGLTEHIQDVARRLAREGYVALAVDYYSRLGDKRLATRFADAGANLRATPPEQAVQDVREAVRYLKSREYVAADRIGIVSFSAGSRFALLSACPSDEIAGIVAYYPRVIFRGQTDPSWVNPVERLRDLSCPLLALYGAEDQWHSPDDMELFRSTLEKHHKTYEVVIYPNAGHSFFDDAHRSYVPEAAKDSWQRALAFFQRYLKE